MWNLGFITEQNFKKHVQLTIQQYGEKLQPYTLKKLNKNLIDPIKMLFDKLVYGYSWEELLQNEIFRQRDKSTNNDIGYFHQRIFQYMEGCTVPQTGWDVIVQREGGIPLPEGDRVQTLYVEMKNKHNTMNSASSSKTYMKMQGQLLADDDCACCLVEAIAKESQNIPWQVSVDGMRQKHRKIRRVSMDAFYELVTGEKDAFYQMCMALPTVIAEVVKSEQAMLMPKDTVWEEFQALVKQQKGSHALALYLLGFPTYCGFQK